MWPFIFKDYKSLELKDEHYIELAQDKDNPDPSAWRWEKWVYPWQGRRFDFLPQGADRRDEWDGDVTQHFTFYLSSFVLSALAIGLVRSYWLRFRSYHGIFFARPLQYAEKAILGTPKDHF
jgi:hypothetical protein